MVREKSSERSKKAKKEDSLIDFEKMLLNYRSRTEKYVPFTNMQVEDVMFINDKRVVSLEYVFY